MKTGLRPYVSTNGARAAAAVLLVLAAVAAAGAARPALAAAIVPCAAPAPRLARLFTPSHPRLGRYDVCTTPQSLDLVAPHDWTIDQELPLDAFGAAGSYDRAALAKLYGGRRVRVARGWMQTPTGFEAWTLLSPYPDAALRRLEPGTLVIRYLIRP